MEVNRVNGAGYQTPPPTPGSGEFAPAPEGQAYVEITTPAPPPASAPSMEEVRAERPERSERNRETGDTLQRAVKEINSSVKMHGRYLDIRIHEASNRRMVTVHDSETNEVIREIPPEKVLDAYASMLEMVGLFVDKRG